MISSLERKREFIQRSANADSIFGNPDQRYFYTDDELRALASAFRLNADLSGLGPVQRSHQVKSAFIRHLGYPIPQRFRGVGRESKPKFRAQLMDIFVQSTTNLQVWNYLPHSVERVKDLPTAWQRTTFADCRYVIIPVKEGRVRNSRMVKGSELRSYANTRVLTVKYQATVPP